MAWNGAGNFQRTNCSFSGPDVWQDDANAGYDIVGARHDSHDQDLAQGINNCLTKDGQNSPTTNLSMNTYKHLNVGDGTARNQYATVGQLQDQGVQALSGVGGTANAITASMNPVISAYVTGAQYTFKAIATNSGATTLKIDSAPAVAIQRNVAALVGGEIVNGRHYTVVYDGTVFQLLNTTANPLFLDSVNNRVGIGTTAPADLLEVAGTSFFPQYWTNYTNSAGGVNLMVRKSRGASVGTNTIVANGDVLGSIDFAGANGTTFTSAANIAAVVDGTPGATNDMPGRLVFQTTADGAGSPTERMRINNSGEVLIDSTATLASSYKFQVGSGSSSTTNVGFSGSNGAGGGAQLAFWGGGSPSLQLGNYSAIQGGAFDNRACIKNHGASFVVLGITAAVGTHFMKWNNATGVWSYDTSSARYKDNIEDSSYGLAEVLAMRPVTFTYKAEPERHDVGFIAEEMVSVIPEVVAKTTEGEPDAISYDRLTSVLCKAIQELNAKVEALEARVQELEA